MKTKAQIYHSNKIRGKDFSGDLLMKEALYAHKISAKHAWVSSGDCKENVTNAVSNY